MSALKSRALLLTATLALRLNASAASAPEECRAISDDQTRLACYDALFSPFPSGAEVDSARDETPLRQVAAPLQLFDISLDSVTLGFNHQSNGRGRELSRSWNRLFAEVALSHNRWSFKMRPRYRIPEGDDSDDNPDIDDYLGYGDFSASYEWHPDLILKTELRHNFHNRDSRTSVELGLVFPLPGPLNGYLEYVNGYGETLIDYNYRSKRIGIGVILNEWK